MRFALLLAILGIFASSAATAQPAAGTSSPELTLAESFLDAEDTDQAFEILNRWLKKNPKDAQALLLRSTARFMTGEVESGRNDLERSLKIDPEQRQGWLNLAALDLSEGKNELALEHFKKSEVLDPAAPDNSLNIGTALLLLGRTTEADARFQQYLRLNIQNVEAFFVVASNYAMANVPAGALAYLRQAIDRDERVRRNARTNPNFTSLENLPAFQELLNTDSYRPPAGSHQAERIFETPYLNGRGDLLDAVISSLQLGNHPFDPRVEVTPTWALIWSDIRLKVSDAREGKTLLELTAPPGTLSVAEWQQRTSELFRDVTVQLHTRKRKPGPTER